MTTSTMAQERSRSKTAQAAEISLARRLYWSVRRELWENRSIYLAPAIVAAVVLTGFFISLIGLPAQVRTALPLSPVEQRVAIEQPYVIAALLLMLIGLLVAVFYCLDALYGERRERSVLFWKSMPISDLTTIVSKASVPILVIPLVTFAVTAATHLIMLLASSAVLAANGMSPAIPWIHVPFIETVAINFSHLVGYHGLWYAPLYGWLLMVSAWANRAPLLWAVLPPAAIGVLEKIAFNTSHFAGMVQHRFLGSSDPGSSGGTLTMDMLASDPTGQYLTAPGLWVGLAVTGVFLFVAVRLHRSRGPI